MDTLPNTRMRAGCAGAERQTCLKPRERKGRRRANWLTNSQNPSKTYRAVIIFNLQVNF